MRRLSRIDKEPQIQPLLESSRQFRTWKKIHSQLLLSTHRIPDFLVEKLTKIESYNDEENLKKKIWSEEHTYIVFTINTVHRTQNTINHLTEIEQRIQFLHV